MDPNFVWQGRQTLRKNQPSNVELLQLMSDTVSWVVQLRIDMFFKKVWDFSVFGSILIWNK